MLSVLKRAFSPDPLARPSAALYVAVVAQARRPFFYRDLGVPDTVDGRFELILLHLFLLIERLNRENSSEAEMLSQRLSEAFFADMDRNLREMGVSDTSMGKRMKDVAEAFFGRMKAYQKVWRSTDDSFVQALLRNVYGTVEDVDVAATEKLKSYALQAFTQLEKIPTPSLMAAQVVFPAEAG